MTSAPNTIDLFARLAPQPADPLLSLISAYRADPRPQKIDLGVGVYREADGSTPVFKAVKAAEAVLLRDQDSKAYLGPEGDIGFLERIARLVFGEGALGSELIAVQTPGGTGALRLAADLIGASRPGGRIWLGLPSWPIHAGIFQHAGLDVRTFPYFDPQSQAIGFDRLMSELASVAPGDVVLLHGACHNPTGADFSREQWAQVGDLLARRGGVPLVDLAYQGLGDGLTADAAGLRLLAERFETIFVAQSCDKNFGLYRERTGALFVRGPVASRDRARSNLLQLARCAWSMPPDHGAAVARTILQSDEMTAEWRAELDRMRDRLNAMRAALADALPRLEPLRRHRGLFALLPLSADAVERLRRERGVYMAGSGRINVAGLTAGNLPLFVSALKTVL